MSQYSDPREVDLHGHEHPLAFVGHEDVELRLHQEEVEGRRQEVAAAAVGGVECVVVVVVDVAAAVVDVAAAVVEQRRRVVHLPSERPLHQSLSLWDGLHQH